MKKSCLLFMLSLVILAFSIGSCAFASTEKKHCDKVTIEKSISTEVSVAINCLVPMDHSSIYLSVDPCTSYKLFKEEKSIELFAVKNNDTKPDCIDTSYKYKRLHSRNIYYSSRYGHRGYHELRHYLSYKDPYNC
jgi:hypothetical protein